MDKDKFLKSGLLEEYVLKITSHKDKQLVEDMLEKHDDIAYLLKKMKKRMNYYCNSKGMTCIRDNPPQQSSSPG